MLDGVYYSRDHEPVFYPPTEGKSVSTRCDSVRDGGGDLLNHAYVCCCSNDLASSSCFALPPTFPTHTPSAHTSPDSKPYEAHQLKASRCICVCARVFCHGLVPLDAHYPPLLLAAAKFRALPPAATLPPCHTNACATGVRNHVPPPLSNPTPCVFVFVCVCVAAVAWAHGRVGFKFRRGC